MIIYNEEGTCWRSWVLGLRIQATANYTSCKIIMERKIITGARGGCVLGGQKFDVVKKFDGRSNRAAAVVRRADLGLPPALRRGLLLPRLQVVVAAVGNILWYII